MSLSLCAFNFGYKNDSIPIGWTENVWFVFDRKKFFLKCDTINRTAPVQYANQIIAMLLAKPSRPISAIVMQWVEFARVMATFSRFTAALKDIEKYVEITRQRVFRHLFNNGRQIYNLHQEFFKAKL